MTYTFPDEERTIGLVNTGHFPGRWSSPPKTLLERLTHTLECYDDAKPDDLAIIATSGYYMIEQTGKNVRTGLTWADLRAIHGLLKAIL